MAEITKDINLNQVAILLSRYQFEMKENNIQELFEQWLLLYPVKWIRLAVVEALYQGRYKVISVEHILSLWLRRGHPTFHFNHEFERMICNNMLGSIATNYSNVAQRRMSQTALPSFYQMEQSTNFSSSLNSETDTTSKIGREETSELLVHSEAQNGELTNTEDELVSNPLFTENAQFDSVTQLTDVKDLLTQLMSKGDLSESIIALEETNGKTERRTISGQSIHEFKPDLDYSALYSKLKAVLQQSL